MYKRQKLKEVKKGNWHNTFRNAVASMYAKGLSKEAIIELLRPRLDDPNKTYDLEQLFSNLDKFNVSQDDIDTSYLLKDLINHQVKKINYLVDKIIPDSGLIVFAGNPKSGKTFFAIQLALAIANGKSFLDYSTTKGFVSCHFFEDNMDRLKRRLDSMKINKEEYESCFELVRKVKDLLITKFKPEGFNIGVNCGEVAGQTVFHAHIHVIPRYKGDVPNPRGGVRNIIPGKGDY